MLQIIKHVVFNKNRCCGCLQVILATVIPAIAIQSATAQMNFEAPNGASGSGSSGVSILDETKNANGHNVYLFSGEYYIEVEDLRIPGRGFDFAWKRKYRSREGVNTAQGENWDFSYNIYVEADGPNDLFLHNGNSRKDSYTKQANDCWTADGFFQEICLNPIGPGYVVTFPDQFTWTLAALDGSASSGKILEMQDSNNNRMTFHYDTLGRLYKIRDTLSDPALEPDESLQPPLAASVPHDIKKNRYISFEPNPANPNGVFYKVTSVGADGEEILGWVGPPSSDKKVDNHARLVPAIDAHPFDNTWQGVVHIGDCKIIPDATYAITTDSGVGTGSPSLIVKTINKPTDGRFWGDIAGALVNNFWTAPDGLVTTIDIVAMIESFQLSINAPHPSRTDLLPQNINGLVDSQDILAVVKAFQSTPFTDHQFAPCTSGCTNCLAIVDREIVLAYYDNTNKIKSISDWAGRTIVYQYYADSDPDGSAGDLKSVTYPVVESNSHFTIPAGHEFPFGKTWTYTYSAGSTEAPLNHNLLTITDAKGQTYLQNIYATTTDPFNLDYDRILTQFYGEGSFNYHYEAVTPDATNNNSATMKTIVNDRVGNVEEIFFNAANLLVMRQEYTGRAPNSAIATTDSVNRPVNPLRMSDPLIFENRFFYNIDFLVIQADFANGNRLVQQFDETYPEVRSHRNLLTRELIPGVLSADQPSVCERWAYEHGFNKVAIFSNGRDKDTANENPVEDFQIHLTIDSSELPDALPASCESLAPRSIQNSSSALLATGTGNVDGHGCPLLIAARALGQNCCEITHNSGGQMTHYIRTCGILRTEVYTYYPPTSPSEGYLQSYTLDAGGKNLTTTFEYDAVGNVTKVTDPNGNDSQYLVNQYNQVVRKLSRPVTLEGIPVRYSQDSFFDGNNNLARMDIANFDEAGALVPNKTRFSTIYEFDDLNYKTAAYHDVDSLDVPIGQLDGSLLDLSTFIKTVYEYDANRNMVLTTLGEATNSNQLNNTISTRFDERDLPYQTIRAEGDANASTTQFDYDPNRNLSFVREGLESSPRIHQFIYDGYNRRVKYIDAENNSATYHYNAFHSLIRKEFFGEEIQGITNDFVLLSDNTYAFDEWNRPSQFQHDFFKYAQGIKQSLTDGQSVTRLAYNTESQVTLITDDRGHKNILKYDTANRIIQIGDPMGNFSQNADSANFAEVTLYDANSNVLSVKENDRSDILGPPETFTTTKVYDELDRLISSTDNVGNQHQYRYDSRNNLVRSTDANGIESRYIYDGINRQTSSIRDMDGDGPSHNDPDDIVTKTFWDDSSRLIGRQDDELNLTLYEYDALNRVTKITYADSTFESAVYDVHDNVVSTTDANGTIVTSTYDQLNRIVSKTVVPGPGVSSDTTQVTYKYDGLSRLVFAQDDDSTIERKYDSLNNIIEETIMHGQPVCGNNITEPGEQCDGGLGCTACLEDNNCCESRPGETGCSVQAIQDCVCIEFGNSDCCQIEWTDFYFCPVDAAECPGGCGYDVQNPLPSTTATYDGVHNRLSCTYPGGRTVDTTYDNADRKSQITEGQFPTITIADLKYIGRSRFARRDLGNGLRASFTYDGIRRMTESTHTLQGSGTIVERHGYSWDPMFNKTSRQDLRTNIKHTLSYDDAYRLSNVSQDDGAIPTPSIIRNTAYNHDGIHNRTTVVGSPDSGPYVGSYTQDMTAPIPDDDHMNQYTSTPFDERVYDDKGNLIEIRSSGGATSLALLEYDYRNQMVKYTDQVSGAVHLYKYDALGRRIGKVVDSTGLTSGPTETRYYYGGKGFQQVIEEQDELGATQATYVYGMYIDDTVQMRRGGQDYYYHCDDLYNTMAITDSAGVVVERYEYGDYGQVEFRDASGAALATQASAIGNPYLFTGRRFDEETGLYWYRTRYYDSAAGRFASRDSIGIWGDPLELGNGLAYVGNNPWTFTDPFGVNPSTGSATGILVGKAAEAAAAAEAAIAAAARGGSVAAASRAMRAARDALILLVGEEVAREWLRQKEKELDKALEKEDPLPPNGPKPPYIPRIDDDGNEDPPGLPDYTPPGDIGEHPGPGWEWKGNGPEGSGEGSYIKPETGEILHPDPNHPGDKPPHQDYTDPDGQEWEYYPTDGEGPRWKPKKETKRRRKRRERRKRNSGCMSQIPMM